MKDYGTMSARDFLAESEREINAAREAREQENRNADKAQRERLERSSPSGARLGFTDLLNNLERDRASVAAPDLGFLAKLRADQALGRRSAAEHNRSYEQFERKYGVHNDAPSIFNFREGEPGQPRDSRFGHGQPYAPKLRAGRRVADAGGAIHGDNEGGRHWPKGEPEGIDPKFLLEIARQIIQMVRDASYPRRPV